MRRRYRRKKISKEELSEKSKEVMKKLHPMAIGIMVSETNRIGEPQNDFERYIVDSTKAILEKRITSEKWIESINRYVLKRAEEMSADDPCHEVGEDLVLTKLSVISSGTKNSSYGLYNYCIAKNDTGWKYYMTSKYLSKINVGDKISLTAKVKSNGEEITFLTRIKIVDVDKGNKGNDINLL